MSQETLRDCPNKTDLTICNFQREQTKRLHALEVLMGVNDNPTSEANLGKINYQITGQESITHPYVTKHTKGEITSFSSVIISQDSARNITRTEVLEIISFDNSDFLYVRLPNDNSTVVSYSDGSTKNIEKIGEFITYLTASTP